MASKFLSVEGGWNEVFDSHRLGELAESTLRRIMSPDEGACPAAELCPVIEQIYSAFALCPYDTVRVVLLGQDPYMSRDQAHGLAFSVPDGIPPPASLRNMLAALVGQGLIGKDQAASGNLTSWARQGMLLINSALTTRVVRAGAHREYWRPFIESFLRALSERKPQLIYILLGNSARDLGKKPGVIRSSRAVLEWGHPSPLNADNRTDGPRNFKNCDCFRRANALLGAAPIAWAPGAGAKPAPQLAAGAIPEAHIESRAIDPAADNLMSPDFVYAFVDGAASGNGTAECRAGYGAVIVDSGIIVHISGPVPPGPRGEAPTNNRAELMALIAALDYAGNRGSAELQSGPIRIVHDSMYAAKTVEEWAPRWRAEPQPQMRANMDLIDTASVLLERLRWARDVQFIHVHSHKKEPVHGDDFERFLWEGNRAVDHLAVISVPAPTRPM